MNERDARMEKLKTFAEVGRKYLERDSDLGLICVESLVIPALQNVLQDLCPEIEERHKIEPEDQQYIDVIHYTSIGTLVSMLQKKIKNKQNVAKDKQNVADKQNDSEDEQESSKDEQNASLRLYDSVHFNDPDEGNYFFRHLNLTKKHTWLQEKKESHAYIASFIIPNDERDEREMSDNLVFWRTYGKEGEGCSLKLHIPRDRLRKVLYGADEVKCTEEILQRILDTLYNALQPLISIDKQSVKEIIEKKLAEVIWRYLEKIRYLYKSEAYEYERECRFVIPELDADKDKIRFEYKEQNNSPYLRHYYQDEALEIEKILISGSCITLGPCVPDRPDVSNCLEILKRQANVYGPKIKNSEISYRKT